jgi:hypothetical protein
VAIAATPVRALADILDIVACLATPATVDFLATPATQVLELVDTVATQAPA